MTQLVVPASAPEIVVKDRGVPEDLQARLRAYDPKSQLGQIVKDCFRHLPAELAGELLDRISSSMVAESVLSLVHIDGRGRRTDLGVVSRRVVTTAGVGFVVDAWQDSVELEIMRYHGFGTGTTAAAVGDTDIETELTTQYASDNTRPTGTLAEGSSANIFQTVATVSPDSGGTIAITEHGVLSSATVGSGTLFDRHVFSAVNVVAGSDSLQATYEWTLSAGG